MTPKAIVELVLRAAWNRGFTPYNLDEDMQKEVLADITDIVDERMREAPTDDYKLGHDASREVARLLAAMLADEVTARENELLCLLDDFASDHRRRNGIAGAYDDLLVRYRDIISQHAPEVI